MNTLTSITKGIAIAMGMVGVTFAENNLPHAASLPRWTGFYTGMDAGLMVNHVQIKSHHPGFTNPGEHCNTHSDFSTFSGGIQLGYMHQFPNDFVSGIETNITVNANQNDSLRCRCPNNIKVSDRFSFSNPMQSTVKVRGGRALNWNKNPLLPYLTVGANFAKTQLTYKNEGVDFYSHNTTRTGWLMGTGIEWSFRQNWSLRAEYAFIHYGNAVQLKIPNVYGLTDPDANARVALHTNSFSIMINYWI